jgi:hypothetical protein
MCKFYLNFVRMNKRKPFRWYSRAVLFVPELATASYVRASLILSAFKGHIDRHEV